MRCSPSVIKIFFFVKNAVNYLNRQNLYKFLPATLSLIHGRHLFSARLKVDNMRDLWIEQNHLENWHRSNDIQTCW